MFELVLFEPEIPPNTGNIIRLCANTGTRLHLIRPLGFELDDKQLQRAGLDYHEYASLQVHDNLAACRATLPERRWFALTTKGSQAHHLLQYRAGDVFLLGPESRGLPAEVLAEFTAATRLRIPMLPNNRSLNLSNAAAVILYEAWRQNDFAGAIQGTATALD